MAVRSPCKPAFATYRVACIQRRLCALDGEGGWRKVWLAASKWTTRVVPSAPPSVQPRTSPGGCMILGAPRICARHLREPPTEELVHERRILQSGGHRVRGRGRPSFGSRARPLLVNAAPHTAFVRMNSLSPSPATEDFLLVDRAGAKEPPSSCGGRRGTRPGHGRRHAAPRGRIGRAAGRDARVYDARHRRRPCRCLAVPAGPDVEQGLQPLSACEPLGTTD